MILPRTILAAVDFSDASRAALVLAARLARHCGSDLHVVHAEHPLLDAAAQHGPTPERSDAVGCGAVHPVVVGVDAADSSTASVKAGCALARALDGERAGTDVRRPLRPLAAFSSGQELAPVRS